MMRFTTTRGLTLLAVGILGLTACTAGDDVAPSPTAEPTVSRSDGGGSTYPTDGAPTASEGAEQVADAESCGADSSDQNVPAEAPKADAWPEVNGIGVPVSDTWGPTSRDGDVWTCFAHSPTGALFASAYIQTGISSAAIREVYITDDPAIGDGDGEDSTGTLIRGYRFISYDTTEAKVELVFETSADGQSGLVVFPVTVYWTDAGWTSTKAAFSSAQPRTITGLTGFVPWSLQS